MMKMFGFSALLGDKIEHQFQLNNADAVIQTEKAICYKHMVPKFEKDKVFVDTEDFILVLDGVVLNKKNFDTEKNWFESVIKLYRLNGERFFEAFRGSFGGILYDKKEEKCIIFSDHIGSKFIYYSLNSGTLMCSTMMYSVYRFLQENHIPYDLSLESAYLLLTYGYMLGSRTLCDKIFRLNAGCYLVFQHGELQEKRYCLLNNEPDNTLTEADAIEIYDREFRRAVALEFDKDVEYGYKHLVSLSGGLDSRMVSWVAHDMGYVAQLNFTFSQSDYWDEIIPKQIARDLKHEWIFKMLDNGLWLYDVDEITRLTGGNVLYYGLAHGNSMSKYVNFKNLGLMHSGQLGDVVLGTFFSSTDPNEVFHLGDGAYSSTYLNKIKKIELQVFDNQEISNFYNRGFNGANNGLLAEMQYTETCSPFMDWDLMNTVLKIPLKYRFGHHLYKKWILAKYPEAANYVWEKIGTTIKEPTIKIKGKDIPLSQFLQKVLAKLFHLKRGTLSKHHMNPIGYYLATNQDLQKFIFGILDDVDLIQDPELRSVLHEIKLHGSDMEKIQAVSLMRAIKMFF